MKKLFIIYVPDSEDINIKRICEDDYYNTINGLKNDSIYFENKFFKVNDTIKKIEFYINNNFELALKLKKFYNLFDFNNNIKYGIYLQGTEKKIISHVILPTTTTNNINIDLNNETKNVHCDSHGTDEKIIAQNTLQSTTITDTN